MGGSEVLTTEVKWSEV